MLDRPGRFLVAARGGLRSATVLAFLVLQGCGGRVCSPSAYVGYVGSDASTVRPLSAADLVSNGEAHDGQRVRVRGTMDDQGLILFLGDAPPSVPRQVIDLDVSWNVGKVCRRKLAGKRVEIDGKLLFIGFQWGAAMPVGYLTDVSRLVVL